VHVLQLHVTIKRTFDICSEKKLKECSLIVVKMHVSMQSKVAADFFLFVRICLIETIVVIITDA